MVIFVHSLGSLWQTRDLPGGSAKIWNTTGIPDGRRIRSCARIFGQVSFSANARRQLAAARDVTGAVWNASELEENGAGRKVKLLGCASRACPAEWWLVTVTDELVGPVEPDGWDSSLTTLISFSMRRSRQEMMFLMRPFAWLRGENGSAVLVTAGGQCHWDVTRW